ncbi:MAG: NADH-quinone oxidoreductase subunit F [Bacteroidales bacterium]|nr:NADH-quinone oxidoreductase subunit F [Bacteroidales bacterium]
MVNPIFIVAIALGAAFLIGLGTSKMLNISRGFMLLAVAAMAAISGSWLYGLYNGSLQGIDVFTAGFKPPFAINLRMTMNEAFLTFMINFFGLMSAIYLWDSLKAAGKYAHSIFLIFLLGLNVAVMTRDIFNLFVFLEITSIATSAMVIYTQTLKSTSAGFKYMIASSIISGLLLLGIVFAYTFGGTLNIDFMGNIQMIKGGFIALFLILIALVLESKPFLANGWALDMYDSANHAVGAMFSAISAPAIIFVIYKVMPIMPTPWHTIIGLLGVVTFIGSNFVGIRQTQVRRMLGYSSVAQAGLLLTVVSISEYLGDKFMFIVLGLLLTNYFAKAGLFWIGGVIGSDNFKDWTLLRSKPIMFLLFGVFVFALAGFPPFPAFFAKWDLIMQLAASGGWWWIALILLGSIFELVYLLRWFNTVFRQDETTPESFHCTWNKRFTILLLGASFLFVSALFIYYLHFDFLLVVLPLIVIAALFVIDVMPIFVKNSITIASIAIYAWKVYPLIADDWLKMMFAAIFLIGGLLTLIPGYSFKGRRLGFYPFAAMTIFGLFMLVSAQTNLIFFMGWELMALGSFILILRGKNAEIPAFRYLMFSAGGAYLLLAAFALITAFADGTYFAAISGHFTHVSITFVLLIFGFLTKAAAIGLHIWIPDAYAEAEDDATPLISGVLINAGVLGLILTVFAFGRINIGHINLYYWLGWMGALTAVAGNMLAIYEEDMKRLIAYSSMAAMGYIIFALSINTKLGILIALYYTVLHFLYKTLLFLSAAGVAYRTKTHLMYQMGGLIKTMPISFIAVLIGIIVAAGMPPLAGFAGKWMFYNAVVMKGWYLQGLLVFFSGIVAFLYLYKLIASVFLGQIKDNLRKVKEAPMGFIIPQVVLLVVLMILSVQPNLLLQPLSQVIPDKVIGEGLQWDGNLAFTTFGYWNAFAIMSVVVIMFAILFLWLYVNSRKAQKVKQFNIVFAAERPFRPETTHVSYNMFAGYNKALGFMVHPLATKFWNGLSNLCEAIADKVRSWYNGDGQVYAIHLLVYALIVYLSLFGGNIL